MTFDQSILGDHVYVQNMPQVNYRDRLISHHEGGQRGSSNHPGLKMGLRMSKSIDALSDGQGQHAHVPMSCYDEQHLC